MPKNVFPFQRTFFDFILISLSNSAKITCQVISPLIFLLGVVIGSYEKKVFIVNKSYDNKFYTSIL
jgi:hypothetical protein